MTVGGTTNSGTDCSSDSDLEGAVGWSGEEITPVCAVVSAVADVKGTDPLELPPLADVIDPDALNSLFTSQSTSPATCVEFRYSGYDVHIQGSGEVEVRPAHKTSKADAY